MKVLYLIGNVDVGGKERLLLDVLVRHDSLPFEAFCIYRKKGSLEEQYRAVCAVNMVSKRVFPFILSLRGFIRNQHIQVIHAQSAYDALLAAIASIGYKTRIVQTVHSYEFAKTRLSKLVEKLSFVCCRKTVFVSNFQMRQYFRVHHFGAKGQNKYAVVYNGVDFSRFQPSFGSGTDILQMAMVGNFVPEKDQYFICRFLHELQQRQYDFQFYFIGSKKEVYAECFDRCANYCHEHGLDACVHFLGRRDDIPSLLTQMDAFVYGSISETFGLAVVEAVSATLPTFVNDLGVFKEITQDGELAVLYKTGDVEDLMAKFVDYLTHRDRYLSQASTNAAIIRQKYSIEKHIANLHNVYLQIL